MCWGHENWCWRERVYGVEKQKGKPASAMDSFLLSLTLADKGLSLVFFRWERKEEIS